MKKTFTQKIFNVTDKIERIRTSSKESGKINVSKIIMIKLIHQGDATIKI